VAVDDQRGLESACSASLEAATCWVVAELEGGRVAGVELTPSPLASGPAAELDEAALHALGIDAVVAACADPRTQALLLAQGVQVLAGASGTARRALIACVTRALGADAGLSHSHDG
jgi:predicted Fe-Mo cluster-binding NifX family protein